MIPMTHDPLCPYTDRVEDEALRDVPCGICELIAKVREDMLAKCIEVVEALPPITDAYGTSDNAGGQGLAIVTRTWLCNRDAALAALRALEEKP
jgi:hypothetical protein